MIPSPGIDTGVGSARPPAPSTGDGDVSQSRRAAVPVSSLECRAYRIPTDQPEADGTLEWTATTVVVVEVAAGDSRGLGWTYGSVGCRAVIENELAAAVVGTCALDVPRCHEAMVRACRNLGRPGIAAGAISAVDIALWDLKARLVGLSLADLFGRCRDDVPVYGSGGFTNYDHPTMAAQLERWVGTLGIPRVKIKIGEARGTKLERDELRVSQCREVVGDEVEIYVDANGGYTAKQAVRVGRRLEDLGVVWFEEPVSSDDLAGLGHVRRQVAMDVAAGEYGYNETYFDHMVGAESVDCVQADVTRCGGYTSWLRIAALAAANG
ncbi:MAG: enolase C-terminal domain-like protein, partial [Acidimicrobiales bacterium]